MSTRQPPEDKSVHLVIEVTAPWRPSPGLSMQALEQESAHDPSAFQQRVDQLARDIGEELTRIAQLPARMVTAEPVPNSEFNRAQADRFHDADR